MSHLTASLLVLEEHPRIFLAPPNTMDSKALVCPLIPSQTSLPYPILGLITENSYGSMSESCVDDHLNIAIEEGEIVKCIRKLE